VLKPKAAESVERVSKYGVKATNFVKSAVNPKAEVVGSTCEALALRWRSVVVAAKGSPGLTGRLKVGELVNIGQTRWVNGITLKHDRDVIIRRSEPHLYFSKETQSVPQRKDTMCMPPIGPHGRTGDYAPRAAGRLRSD
jgi:hypothetical protein